MEYLPFEGYHLSCNLVLSCILACMHVYVHIHPRALKLIFAFSSDIERNAHLNMNIKRALIHIRNRAIFYAYTAV